ncbi:MAG: methylmalonyl Co-A mutase-associated GTPase MeaB [Deltaproteobacteria bacterium]|jgi:LAO/AO transport system kinase|nr:methylmalonyl Co-A mutase-associated GTPase MeaB [Deltaproteobacteria bacterium]
MLRSEIAGEAQQVMSANKGAVSRALNLVEDRRAESHARVAELLAALKDAPKAMGGHRVGLTGPPGVGKSTLTSALARALRRRGRTVGVVAIDPSSVRSGGSLLGDRARMSFDPTDNGLFVRSLATAGEVGGLAYAANSSVRVLGAAYDTVIVETTGVGQSEIDIVHVADTVVLVIQPGSGDVLQFLKAGIMEIPDILVVNKADQDELARRAVADLRGALRTATAAGAGGGEDAAWEPPIIATSATKGTGIDELIDALDDHRTHLDSTLGARRRRGEIQWALDLFSRKHGEHGVSTLGGIRTLRARAQRDLDGGETPLSLCEHLSREYVATLGQTA